MGTLTKIDNKDTLESNINFKPIVTNCDDQSLIAKDILTASETGFVSSLVDSNLALVPKLILNDYSKSDIY